MVTVVIAYRDMGCQHRRVAFDFVLARYQSQGFDVIVEHGSDDATFTKASGLNAGIARAPEGVIVHSDPDSFVPEETLRAAIDLAAAEDGMVVPFDRYLYLTEAATAEVLAGRTDVTEADAEDFGPNGVGNLTVFSKATWRRCGGYDERFGLWGGDDVAFATAAEAYTQPTRRLDGDVIHLYHPRLPQSIPSRRNWPYLEQFAIVAEYRDAAADGPEAVRRLVEAR